VSEEARPAPSARWDEELASADDIADAQRPPTDDERQATLDLVRWFTRRYPTYAERAAYIRRKWQEAEKLRQAGVSKS